MITKRKLRWEIRRVTANSNAIALENDFLKADNMGLLKERNELRKLRDKLEVENKALLETVSMLYEKNTALTEENKSMKLRIMSLEALWSAKQRRKENAKSA